MKIKIIDEIAAAVSNLLKQNKLKLLEAEKAKLQEELKITEGKFLQHKISDDFYKKISNEKNKKLIVIDTQIEITKIEDRLKKYEDDISKLNPKRRQLVKKLFERKDQILRELSKAQGAYFTRKMDEKGYKEFANEKQSELISVEAEINRLYKEEAKEILKEAEKKMSMTEIEELNMRAERMASDIVEQLPHNYGGKLSADGEELLNNRRRMLHRKQKQ